MTASIIYKGDLRCECTHLQSGTQIETDAPTDNRGKGERFSPTDTLCVALATCIVTTMALKANDMNINLAGTKIDVTKHMILLFGGSGSLGNKFIEKHFTFRRKR